MIGIGYQQYRNLYEEIKSENCGQERYLIYFGRAHIVDHETEVNSRGFLKIGRGKFATALMRGRNQPGVDFRIYAELIFSTNEQTYLAEKVIKDVMSHKNIKMSQGQRELYDISDAELNEAVDVCVSVIKAETYFEPIEVQKYFLHDHPTKIEKNTKRENTLSSFLT